ncbi:MAG: NAD(P)-dependent oxidoreductase [Hyphomicrobiales bacterium]|nr:NAD(P)-dependent oxidoreductase [Hyphomicrobiales bacterium]MBV9592087.1 NAD(P)-dependent oxidoreductase [Hyphomicrobiales bacterium]
MSFSNALVTGASGFIGRALVSHLLAIGKRTIAVGRPSSCLPAADRQIRLEATSAGAILESLHGEAVDLVFHCAAYGVRPADRDAARMLATNVTATDAWVEAAAALGARAFVHVGSCSEYGPITKAERIRENHPLDAPDLYGASKAAGGRWGAARARALRLPFQWVRLFGVFGPGEAQHRLLPYMRERLCRGERVDLTSGLQWRDLLYVEDAAKGLLRAAELALEGRLGPFNLCTGEPVTVRAMAEEIARQMGAPAELLDFGARPVRADEQMWMVGDPSLLANAGGLRHSIDLSEGVALSLQALGRSNSSRVEP